jgi:hypothetical protein
VNAIVPQGVYFFLEHQQRGRLRQRLFLAPQLRLQLLDGLGLLTQLLAIDLGGKRFLRLLADLSPGIDLLGKQALAAAILTELHFGQCGCLQHDSEALLAAQSRYWVCLPGCITLLGFAAPGVQRIVWDAGFPGEHRHGDVIGWQHSGRQAGLEFIWILFHG